MESPVTSAANLDHIGFGVVDAEKELRRLQRAGILVPVAGEECDDFRWVLSGRTSTERGIRIELLDANGCSDGFIGRFLSHSEGAHHITFEVRDIEKTLASVRRAGFETSQEDLSYPPWKEAFIHPNSGLGTVVQIASSIYGYPSVAEYTVPVSHDKMPHRRCARNTEWWRVAMDTTAPPRNVRVSSVALSVDDHDRANTLFATVLEGAATELDVHRTRYSWPSGSIEVTSRGSRGISALFFDADTNSVAVDKFTIGSTPFIERPAAH